MAIHNGKTTMETIKLRYYQEAAIAKTWSWVRNNQDGNPLIVLPTGAGKTIVIAKMIADCLAWGKRIVLTTHNRELLSQAGETLSRMGITSGMYGASLSRSDTDQDVILAQIQSVYNKGSIFKHRDAIFIDEAHRVNSENDDSMFLQFIQGFTSAKVFGFTATPYRLGSGLCYGDGNVFTDVSYSVSVAELIKERFLSPLKNKNPKCHIDGSKLKVRNGEFTESSQQEAYLAIADAIVEDFVTKTEERRSTLVFCSGVEQAWDVKDRLVRRGLSSTIITGETAPEDRDEAVALFKSGKIKYLININVLTEGFDAPNVDCVVLLRATVSPGLYYQMVGRGLRLCAGKEFCLILDYGENILRHGPIDAINPPSRKNCTIKGSTTQTKVCHECDEVVAANTRTCPACHAELMEEVSPWEKLSSAGGHAVLSEEDWTPILSMRAWEHRKKNAVDGDLSTLAVGYYTMPNHSGFPIATQFVCVEHYGYAGVKAKTWWSRFNSLDEMPKSAKEAAEVINTRLKEGSILPPTAIMTRPSSYNAKYLEVVDVTWEEGFIKDEAVEFKVDDAATTPTHDEWSQPSQSLFNL